MRNIELVFITCLAGTLLGCSNKPAGSDIAAGVNAYWGGCVKITDVSKTNGVENGNTYRVSYTYKLEVLDDKSRCSLENSMELMKIAMEAKGVGVGADPYHPAKTGDVYTVSNETIMVKSEKGWVFQ